MSNRATDAPRSSSPIDPQKGWPSCNFPSYISLSFLGELASIRGGDMRNHVGALALSLPLALAGAGSPLAAETAAAPDAAAQCSEATLRGTYLFATSGFNIGGKFKGPSAAAGYNLVNGNGHLRTVVSFSLNGKITRFERDTGTYTVNTDCTGTITG